MSDTGLGLRVSYFMCVCRPMCFFSVLVISHISCIVVTVLAAVKSWRMKITYNFTSAADKHCV